MAGIVPLVVVWLSVCADESLSGTHCDIVDGARPGSESMSTKGIVCWSSEGRLDAAGMDAVEGARPGRLSLSISGS